MPYQHLRSFSQRKSQRKSASTSLFLLEKRFGCIQSWVTLLPVRPPSRTYLGLGVMLEPYALDVVFVSGHWGRDWQTTFRGAPIIFVTPIALEL